MNKITAIFYAVVPNSITAEAGSRFFFSIKRSRKEIENAPEKPTEETVQNPREENNSVASTSGSNAPQKTEIQRPNQPVPKQRLGEIGTQNSSGQTSANPTENQAVTLNRTIFAQEIDPKGLAYVGLRAHYGNWLSLGPQIQYEYPVSALSSRHIRLMWLVETPLFESNILPKAKEKDNRLSDMIFQGPKLTQNINKNLNPFITLDSAHKVSVDGQSSSRVGVHMGVSQTLNLKAVPKTETKTLKPVQRSLLYSTQKSLDKTFVAVTPKFVPKPSNVMQMTYGLGFIGFLVLITFSAMGWTIENKFLEKNGKFKNFSFLTTEEVEKIIESRSQNKVKSKMPKNKDSGEADLVEDNIRVDKYGEERLND